MCHLTEEKTQLFMNKYMIFVFIFVSNDRRKPIIENHSIFNVQLIDEMNETIIYSTMIPKLHSNN